jgi:hypothetical protein
MISAGLASARAIAAKEQRYAGIRFQNRYQEGGHGCQYIIFIVQDPEILANGFRAVEGLQPIKLPDSVGVMDLMVRTDHRPNRFGAENPDDRPLEAGDLDDTDAGNLVDDRNIYITDTTSFSIVFSPSGKLVIHNVRLRNRDGHYRPVSPNDSMDDIFNSPENIENRNIGMFVQDDYAEHGLGAEKSRNRFVIYDRSLFDEMDEDGRFDYLHDLDVIHINPYTGTMINR